MKVTITVVVDGKNDQDYAKIKARLEAEKAKATGWTLIPEPLIHRMTAVKVENVESLT